MSRFVIFFEPHIMPPKQKALDKQAQLEEERRLKAQAELDKLEDAKWSIGAKDKWVCKY